MPKADLLHRQLGLGCTHAEVAGLVAEMNIAGNLVGALGRIKLAKSQVRRDAPERPDLLAEVSVDFGHLFGTRVTSLTS